jgi:four helix bundle protein
MSGAAVSIASNIAEGKGKSSDGEFIVFLSHARGSSHELETQALSARDLGYLRDGAATKIDDLAVEIGKMLSGLIHFLRGQRERISTKCSQALRLKTGDCQLRLKFRRFREPQLVLGQCLGEQILDLALFAVLGHGELAD